MSEIITLILAWRMAKQYNENESKAVYLCANKLWMNIKDDHVKHLVMQLANKKTSEKQRIKAINKLETGLRAEKLL